MKPIEPICDPIPVELEEYMMYQGDAESLQKNFDYIVDTSNVYKDHPDKDLIDDFWVQFWDDDTYTDTVAEFVVEWDAAYGEHFRKHAAMSDGKVKYTPDSSPGRIWKWYGFKDKGSVHDHILFRWWLSIYMADGPFFNWVEPYTLAPKSELTTLKSILAHKSRVFYMVGVLSDIVGKLYCDNFSNALKELPWCAVGTVWQYGGIDDMRKEQETFLESHPDHVVTDDDCSKYDLTRHAKAFSVEVTLRCRYPNRMPNFEKVIVWLFRQAYFKFLILPARINLPDQYLDRIPNWVDAMPMEGSCTYVLVCCGINPSGFFSTTEGNCVDNFFIQWRKFCKIFDFTWDEFTQTVYIKIYSDDIRLIEPAHTADFHETLKNYAQLGRVVKRRDREPDRDLIDRVFCGVQFLEQGFIIAKAKAYHSANRRGKLSNQQFGQKLQTLLSLFGNDEERMKFYNYIKPIIDYYGLDVSLERAREVATGEVRIIDPLMFGDSGYGSGVFSF